MFNYNDEQIAQEKNNMILAEKLYDFNNGNTDNDKYFKFNYTHGFIDLKHSQAIFNPPYIENTYDIDYEINCVNNFDIEEKCYIKSLNIKTLDDLIRCEYIDKSYKNRTLKCFKSEHRLSPIGCQQFRGCTNIKIGDFIFIIQILDNRKIIFINSGKKIKAFTTFAGMTMLE
jgi:hypothetical protein